MGFKKGHKGFRTKESYEKADGSFRTQEYKEKMRKIALDRNYGKWLVGRKLPKSTRDKIALANIGHSRNGWKLSEETRHLI